MEPERDAANPAERFARLVRMPETDLKLDEAALCIAACARPSVDVDASLRALDDLAGAATMPTFAAVRSLLFEREGFRGDTDDYGDPRNSFLDSVVERRRGIPITLSVLVIEVARRLGVEVLGIGMPGHFLVREASVGDTWCDPFHGGAELDFADCTRLFAMVLGGARPLRPEHLAPTPPRAILSRMLANLEQGRFGTDPAQLAMLGELHLAIPGVPLEQQVQLARALARGGAHERAERAYEELAASAPDGIAETLRAESGRLRARWN